MVLADCLVGKSLPFAGVRGRYDDPLSERLASPRRVEEMCPGNRECTSVCARVGQLEDHRALGSREAGDDAARALQAGHPEYLRAPDVLVPRSQGVADVIEATLRVVHSDSLVDEAQPLVGQRLRDEHPLAHRAAHSGIEELDARECERLLACRRVGSLPDPLTVGLESLLVN